MDGWITIGTKIDTKQLEKDYKKLEKELAKYQKEAEKLTSQKAELEVDTTNLKEQQDQYEIMKLKVKEYKEELQRLREEQKKLLVNEKGYMVVPEENRIEYTDYSRRIREMKDEYNQMLAQVDRQAQLVDETTLKYDEQQAKLEQINAELMQNAQMQNDIGNKMSDINAKLGRIKGIKEVNNEIGKISNKMTGILSKVARWTLAIFSIRSIYSILSSASSQLQQYNQQYATDLQYIRYALAQMIAPVLEYIVKLMATILNYINYIAQAWFGVNLFANASAKAFQDAKNSTGGMAKDVSNIKKDLQQANFDEMNVLTDTSANAGAGTGTGGVSPSFDLSNLENMEMPQWIKWIADHKEEILGFLGTVGLLIAGIKLGKIVSDLGSLIGNLNILKGIGIVAILAGIVISVKAIIDYMKDPTWNNFGNFLIGIGVILAGLSLIIGGFPLTITAIVVLIVGIIVKNWEKIKQLLEKAKDWINNLFDKIQEFIASKLDWVQEHFGLVGTAILTAIRYWFEIVRNLITGFIDHFKSVFEKLYGGAKQILDGIIQMFKGDFWGGLQTVGNGIKTFFSGVWENILYSFTWCWSAILKAFQNGGEIFDGFKEGIITTIKNLINGLITGINWAIAQPFNRLNQTLNRIKGMEVLGAKPFDGLWSYNPIPVPQIPRLAKGSILNNPGKGVLVNGGRAIAGEAGREAYVPLSDKQLLEELGSTIGKYITVNATINNSMNGRLISRVLQQIKTEQDFAYNT